MVTSEDELPMVIIVYLLLFIFRFVLINIAASLFSVTGNAVKEDQKWLISNGSESKVLRTLRSWCFHTILAPAIRH